jgi:hypothetical protein
LYPKIQALANYSLFKKIPADLIAQSSSQNSAIIQVEIDQQVELPAEEERQRVTPNACLGKCLKMTQLE